MDLPSHTHGIAIAGAFVVLATFAWTPPAHGVSVRWIAFGVRVAVAVMALASLVERTAAARSDGATAGRMAAILITGASAVVAIALIVLMPTLHGATARWWAFGLGAGLIGLSLLVSTIHELSSERVRHELEVARAAAATGEPATVTAN